MSDTTVARATGLMQELEELWCAERCGIDWRFEDNDCDPWSLLLSWVQERGNPHGADWCEYTWQFYDTNPEDAICQAIEWCRGLLPFEQCAACDGRGWYSKSTAEFEAGIQTQCEDCTGSGLARFGGDGER